MNLYAAMAISWVRFAWRKSGIGEAWCWQKKITLESVFIPSFTRQAIHMHAMAIFYVQLTWLKSVIFKAWCWQMKMILAYADSDFNHDMKISQSPITAIYNTLAIRDTFHVRKNNHSNPSVFEINFWVHYLLFRVEQVKQFWYRHEVIEWILLNAASNEL